MVLGLDLQGGSHILLQVDGNDVRRQKIEQLFAYAEQRLRGEGLIA